MDNMQYFEKCLEAHFLSYPKMQAQDVVKLCYQATFGPMHILKDAMAAKKYFIKECEETLPSKGDIFKEISKDYCRVDIAAWKFYDLPCEWLASMFAYSAENSCGDEELFCKYLDVAKKYTDEDYIKEYLLGGVRPVHHSEGYREEYSPSYRVVSSKFIKLFPIIEAAAKLPNKNGARVIAIDGRAASGKTTAAAILCEIIGASVLHMDDFFLPIELRSKDRFATPGGNVHHERFANEVLPVLAGCESFSYSIFDCGIMDYSGKRLVENLPWRIVEGSYSCHKAFGDYADIKVFFDVDKEEQMRRIIARDGEKMAEMFRTRWIPLEEEYHKAHNIIENADIIIK